MSIEGYLPSIPETGLGIHIHEIVAEGQQTTLETKGGSPTNHLPVLATGDIENFASGSSGSNITDHGKPNPCDSMRYPARISTGKRQSTENPNGKIGISVIADESDDRASILAESDGGVAVEANGQDLFLALGLDVERAGPESSSKEGERIAGYGEASDSRSADSTKGSSSGTGSSFVGVSASIPVATQNFDKRKSRKGMDRYHY